MSSSSTVILFDFLLPIAPIATVIGVFVAAFAIYKNTSNAKKRATLDIINSERNNLELKEAVAFVSDVSKNENGIMQKYLSSDDEAKRLILQVLNQREFVAAAIACGALDEKMYKTFACSMYLRDWKRLESFVIALRNEEKVPDTIFQEFQKLAKKWQKKPLKIKH